MGRKGKKRRKSSDDSLDNGNSEKREKWCDSPETGESGVLSSVLSQVNSILYERELDSTEEEEISIFGGLFTDQTVNTSEINKGEVINMASSNNNNQPSNADIMSCLADIRGKLNTIDDRLNKQSDTLDSMKQKMGGFENEIKKLWTKIHDNEKKTDERLSKVEESVEAADFNLQVLTDKVSGLERKEEEMRNEVLYLQSQSMRNNLVFKNIPEEQSDTIENTESIVRKFLVEKMKLAQDIVDSMKFDRVHRMGQKRDRFDRHIVAKFTLFKERELVRRQSGALKGTTYAVFEQFPKEINEKRQKLIPQMKEEKRKGNRAWISYDTLYVNGRPVKAPNSNSSNSTNSNRR